MKRGLAVILAVITMGLAAPANPAGATQRSGALHVTKECTQYDGSAGSFCTITSSNINAIRAGMKVVYASAAGVPTPGVLDSDLVIQGPGHNRAFGHVLLDLSTLTGVVTFSGGTGRFSGFHAAISVTCPEFPACSWDGAYTFAPTGRAAAAA
jgi:hypothetical protein